MKFSVVIPSYNSSKTILSCLQAIYSQKTDPGFEVILVDSSEDDTAVLVEKNYPNVKIVKLAQKTDPGTGRNLGVEKSSGEYILFVDSDCELSNNWMETALKIYESEKCEAVGGAVIPANSSKDHVGWAGYISEFREFLPQYSAGYRSHLPSCNLSYKKSVFVKQGGFNSYYYPQEDLYFNHKFTEQGNKIYFDPRIYVKHWHRSELKPFIRHQKNIGYITASLLQIANLEGSALSRTRIFKYFVLPFIPVVKFFRTLNVFFKHQRPTIFDHYQSFFIFGMGLLPWTSGFFKGLINPKFKQEY